MSLREGDLWELEAMGFGSERKRRVRWRMRKRKKKELKDVTVELPYHP